MTGPDERRCARGRRCLDRIDLTGGSHDPEWVGVILADDETGICRPCVETVRDGIAQLPDDVTHLRLLLPPSMAVRYRDPGIPDQPRIKLHAPIPLRLDPLALIELIDHEVCAWAESVCREVGIGWSRHHADRLRMQDRITRAADVLLAHLPVLLGLGDTEHPARSLGLRRADGHDPDRTVRAPWDYMVTRTGCEGALVLLDLHAKAVRKVGAAPSTAAIMACPRCHRRSLLRDHTRRRVYCRREDTCGWVTTDDVYERIRLGTPDDFLALADRLETHGGVGEGFWPARNHQAREGDAA